LAVYDPQTRSALQTYRPFPSKSDKRDQLAEKADGSRALHFGPEAPAGKEDNRVQTIDGKGWFAISRLCDPEETWFDKISRLSEIERAG